MWKTIVLYNHKGGCGKSLLCTNLAGTLAALKYKVLVIDNDPQCNASSRLGFFRTQPNVELMYQGYGPLSYFPVCYTDFLYVVPGSRTLGKFEKVLYTSGGEYGQLYEKNISLLRNSIIDMQKELQASGQRPFDFVIIDTPPAEDNMLVKNALMASHGIIIPVDDDGPNSMENLDTVFDSISEMQTLQNNPDLKFLGVVHNRYEDDSISKQMVSTMDDYLEKQMGKIVAKSTFKTKIREYKKFQTSSFKDLPIAFSDPKSQASENFLLFTKEVIKKVNSDGKAK